MSCLYIEIPGRTPMLPGFGPESQLNYLLLLTFISRVFFEFDLLRKLC